MYKPGLAWPGALEAERLGLWPVAWTTPQYPRKHVDRAGEAYGDSTTTPEDREVARTVINNWRSSHSFPLNTLQINLRRSARQVDAEPTVAQRIKRLPSIRLKLERFSGMTLSRMQDIGGCRAVLSSVDAVEDLVQYYKSQTRIKHALIREDPYIFEPNASGYRGYHLVFKYHSDRTTTWNGLRIEMQVRSSPQHAWATAVETVGTFTRQALKSSQGRADWLRFFALMSSAMALQENTPIVPDTPADPRELRHEIRRYAEKLSVVERLALYGTALRHAEEQITDYQRDRTVFLLELYTGQHAALSIRAYDNPLVAGEMYSALERATEGDPEKDIVLVSVESLDSLRRAYPNYFLDTTAFVDSVKEVIE